MMLKKTYHLLSVSIASLCIVFLSSFGMEIPLSKRPPITSEHRQLADLLRTELAKASLNTQKIRDLLDLGAGLVLSRDEITQLREIAQTISPRFVGQINQGLVAPAVTLPLSRDLAEGILKIRERVFKQRPVSKSVPSFLCKSPAVKASEKRRRGCGISKNKKTVEQKLYGAIKDRSSVKFKKILADLSADAARTKRLLEYQDPNSKQNFFHAVVLNSFTEALEILLTKLTVQEACALLCAPDKNGFSAVDYMLQKREGGILQHLINCQASLCEQLRTTQMARALEDAEKYVQLTYQLPEDELVDDESDYDASNSTTQESSYLNSPLFPELLEYLNTPLNVPGTASLSRPHCAIAGPLATSHFFSFL